MPTPRLRNSKITQKIKEIEDIEFSATAKCLEDKEDEQVALQIYYEKHSLARLKPSDVWELLRLLNSNKVICAKKTI